MTNILWLRNIVFMIVTLHYLFSRFLSFEALHEYTNVPYCKLMMKVRFLVHANKTK